MLPATPCICYELKISQEKIFAAVLRPTKFTKILGYTVGLSNILVLRYYHDKYIHDNITASILAYRNNHANDSTATTIDTASTKPLSAMQCSRCNLKTSSLKCSTTCILCMSRVQIVVY